MPDERLDERLRAKIVVTEAGCWEWIGSDVRGYGQVRRDNRCWLTHRWVYTQLVGPVPAEMHLDHLCRNPPCCNPAHLEPVTPAENYRRGIGNQNVGRTHCRKGHPLSGDNLRIESYGSRRCKECQRETSRRYKARKRAERQAVGA